MPSGRVDLVLHVRQLPSRLLLRRLDLLHLGVGLKLHGDILHPPAKGDRDDQVLDVTRKGQITRMQGHHRVHQRHFFAVDLNHVALPCGADCIPPTPAVPGHADLLGPGGRASQSLHEIHTDLVGGPLLVPREPHHKRRRPGKHARVESEFGLRGRIGGNQQVGNLERGGVALEEVGEVDQPVAALGVGVGDQFVVGQSQREDVRVDYYDAPRVGAVADHVGVEAVDNFFLALGRAFVDGALGNAVSGFCRQGFNRGRTLMHSSHGSAIAELGSSYHDTNNTLRSSVSARKSW